MTEPATTKARELVETLFERTQAKKISWAPTFKGDAVETTLGRYTIRIVEEFNRDNEDYDHYVTVSDQIGTNIDTITYSVLGTDEKSPRVGEFKFYWQLVDALYKAAHRQATGADQALEEILDILNDE